MAVFVPPDPVHVEVDVAPAIARWRPFVHWLLAVPHVFVLYALQVVQGALTFAAFFTVLFTKRIPDSIFDIIVMTRRYEWRVVSYVACLRESYPPFELTPAAADPGTDPARLAIDRPGELNRFLPLVKWLLVLPHAIVLGFLGFAAAIAVLVGYVAVIATGRFPEGIAAFVVGVYRWNARVLAYAGLLTDRYPPFSLD